MKIKRQISEFRFRYSLALTLIFMLSVGSFVGIYFLISYNSSNAEIINISGRQRMLSQRIAKYCLLITEKNELSNYSINHDALQKSIALMEDSHKFLVEHLAKYSQSPINRKINNLYFGQTNLNKQTKDFLAKAKQITQGNSSENDLNYILQASHTSLLLNLDQAVKLYEEKNNIFQTNLFRFEVLIFSFTLITLILEILFIFKPTEKNLENFIRAQEADKESIEFKSNQLRELLFSYSHTFKEPIRILNVYTGILKTKYKSEDEAKLNEYFATMEEQNLLLKKYLDDMQKYLETESKQ